MSSFACLRPRLDGVLTVKAVGASANVRVQLKSPCDVAISGPWAKGERTSRVREIRFFADDAKTAVTVINERAESVDVYRSPRAVVSE